MFKEGQTVRVIDTKAVKEDPFLDKEGLEIIEKSDFTGEITKIEDGIHFVGFKNEAGWVTQGYKEKEIQGVK